MGVFSTVDDTTGIHQKVVNNMDNASFPNNSKTRLSEIEGDEQFCSSVLNGSETASIFKDKDVSSEQKYSQDELPQSLNNDSVNDREHLQSPIDKECDHNTVKDIGVDEGNNHELKKCELVDSTQEEASDDISKVSSKSVEHKAGDNNSLDLDSLLNLGETGNNPIHGISDCVVDRSYLDELLASANNPFLEDAPVEKFSENEKQAVNITHPSNPFDFVGDEPVDNSAGLDETSNKFPSNKDLSERMISSKNPFLDTSSFKLAMEDYKEAVKLSGNNFTVQGTANKETTTCDEEKKIASDDKAKDPSLTPNVKMKVPGQSDSPANGPQFQHEPLDSSFASMNPYPPLVSYSGQIPFSGSMSLRSEGSATSNRSFAFPVLQTEWKTSPVRMAKADRKHSSWKHTLLCCNF